MIASIVHEHLINNQNAFGIFNRFRKYVLVLKNKHNLFNRVA